MTETEIQYLTDLYVEVDSTLTGEACWNCGAPMRFVISKNTRERVCHEDCTKCNTRTPFEPYLDDEGK